MNKHRQKDNLKNNNDFNKTSSQLLDIQLKLSNSIDEALADKQTKGKIYLGKVSISVVNEIKNILGIDIENRKHLLVDNDIRHMINAHGGAKTETKKDQIAITKNDILNIPYIVDNPDAILRGTPNKDTRTGQSNYSVRYIKKYANNITYVVEIIPISGKILKIKTMWKIPFGVSNDNNDLPYTSETKAK